MNWASDPKNLVMNFQKCMNDMGRNGANQSHFIEFRGCTTPIRALRSHFESISRHRTFAYIIVLKEPDKLLRLAQWV